MSQAALSRNDARKLGLLGMLTLLLATGCERAVLGFVNRGVPPPEASIVYAADLGLSLDIYRPTVAKAGGAPVVVFFYGGSWQRGSRTQYRFVGQRMAENGILAIVADYRTWPQAGFPEFVDDAARAVDWSFENARAWGGDPSRVFVAGHSAGAQLAALVATDARYLAKHGLSPRRLAGAIGLSGPYDFAITGNLVEVFGPTAQWPQAQAVNFVDGDEPPFLLVHGSKDGVVETRDSVQLADLLRSKNVATRLLLLPEGGHSTPMAGLYDPARAPEVLPAILDFIAATPAATTQGGATGL